MVREGGGQDTRELRGHSRDVDVTRLEVSRK